MRDGPGARTVCWTGTSRRGCVLLERRREWLALLHHVDSETSERRYARSTVYYLPRPVSAADLDLMKQIDRLHMEFPFAGARMLRRLLAANGSKVGRRHVKTLMQRMGIQVLYRRPRTTKPEPGGKIYPYLLRGLQVTRPNQVWAMDITYIPMAKGFVYLAVVLDWFRGASCRGACRSRWRRRSASRSWKRLWRAR